MRIVNLQRFLELPAGTVFCKYEPQIFDEIRIKGDNIGRIDFGYQSLLHVRSSGCSELMDLLFKAEEFGEAFELDLHCSGRDGCFDDEQLFAVFERDDMLQIMERLMQAFIQSGMEMPA